MRSAFALRFSRKLYRYAKGPISEGAGIERSEMTGGVSPGVRPLRHRYAMPPLPKGEARARPEASLLNLIL